MRRTFGFHFIIALASPIAVLAAVVQPAATPANAPPVAAPTVDPNAPKIQFAETVHDFGVVRAGDIMSWAFVFTNTGGSSLEITQVNPGCGCTTAGEWDHRVEPGKTGQIPLQVNTANFRGPVVKTPSIVCNDPTQPTIGLQMKADIRLPVDFVPNMVIFSLNPDSPSNQVQVVKLTNNLSEAVEFGAPEVSNPAFRAELKTVKPGKEFELHVFALNPFNPGTVQGAINLKRRTGTNAAPLVSLPVMAVVQPSLVALPMQLYLPPGPLATPPPAMVMIQNNGSNAVSILKATVNLDNVQAQVVEDQPGRQFRLILTFPPGFEIPAGVKAAMTVRTSDPRNPELSVPIVQSPRSTLPVLPPPAKIVAAPPPPESIAAPRRTPTVVPLPPTPPPPVLDLPILNPPDAKR